MFELELGVLLFGDGVKCVIIFLFFILKNNLIFNVVVMGGFELLILVL